MDGKLEIKELRTLAGLSRQEFTEYFGMSRRSVEKWENGERNCPEYLRALMEYKLKPGSDASCPAVHPPLAGSLFRLTVTLSDDRL